MGVRLIQDSVAGLLVVTGETKALTVALSPPEMRELGRHLYALAEQMDPPRVAKTHGKVVACAKLKGSSEPEDHAG